MTTLSITVHGTPAPQGSKNVNRHGAVYESSEAVRPWRVAVTDAAVMALRGLKDTWGKDWAPLSGPVGLEVYFHVRRLKGHYGTGRNAGKIKLSAPVYPPVQPDLSKLIRATEDALTDAGVWRDDAQVVAIMASKYYANDGFTGAHITITEYRKGLE